MPEIPAVRLCHLYPDELNIYADRGNIAVFAQRLAWRGLTLEVTEARPTDSVDPNAHDLYYLGGGQDRDQAIVAQDLLATKADALRTAAADGAVFLAVCGGYQLAGSGYTAVDGNRLPGIGILDIDTRSGDTRLIGDVVLDVELNGERKQVVGYENHAGRTYLGADATPFGSVVFGHGNTGETGYEGATQNRVVGTYLHGPLLPKNPWLADTLLGWAIEYRTGSSPELQPLDDTLERNAHDQARARAGVKR